MHAWVAWLCTCRASGVYAVFPPEFFCQQGMGRFVGSAKKLTTGTIADLKSDKLKSGENQCRMFAKRMMHGPSSRALQSLVLNMREAKVREPLQVTLGQLKAELERQAVAHNKEMQCMRDEAEGNKAEMQRMRDEAEGKDVAHKEEMQRMRDEVEAAASQVHEEQIALMKEAVETAAKLKLENELNQFKEEVLCFVKLQERLHTSPDAVDESSCNTAEFESQP